jgi:PTS system beta-glucosides-specific IIC component
MDYKKMKNEIIEHVGGEDNISNVAHCATRLRLVLKDESKFDEDNLRKIDGVINTIKMGGQCQIIVGQNVKDLYEEFAKSPEASYESSGKKFILKDFLYGIGEFMSASIGVAITPIIGGGLIKAILTILVQMGLMSSAGDTYTVLWFASDAVFQFMPIFIAIGASRKLNANTILAVYCVCIMLSPTYAAFVSAGTAVTIFGMNVPLNSYYSTFLPALLTVVVMAYLERILKKIIPNMLQSLLIPFLIVLIMTPISLLVTGPMATVLAEWITKPLIALSGVQWLLIPILGLIMPIMIMFGLHGPIFMFTVMTFVMTYGYDPIVMPASLCSHAAMGAVALAVAIKSKTKTTKENSLSSCLSCWGGGVSEPVIFGVLLQNSRSMVAACLGGMVGAIFAGILGLKNYAMVGSGLLFIPTFVGPESSMWIVVLCVAISIAAGFVLGIVLYKDKEEEQQLELKAEA